MYVLNSTDSGHESLEELCASSNELSRTTE